MGVVRKNCYIYRLVIFVDHRFIIITTGKLVLFSMFTRRMNIFINRSDEHFHETFSQHHFRKTVVRITPLNLNLI